MAYLATKKAFDDILLRAFASFMANFVAFEAKLGVAVEGVMLVGATQDAVESGAFVRTLTSHVTKLFTVAALNGRIVLEEVP